MSITRKYSFEVVTASCDASGDDWYDTMRQLGRDCRQAYNAALHQFIIWHNQQGTPKQIRDYLAKLVPVRAEYAKRIAEANKLPTEKERKKTITAIQKEEAKLVRAIHAEYGPTAAIFPTKKHDGESIIYQRVGEAFPHLGGGVRSVLVEMAHDQIKRVGGKSKLPGWWLALVGEAAIPFMASKSSIPVRAQETTIIKVPNGKYTDWKVRCTIRDKSQAAIEFLLRTSVAGNGDSRAKRQMAQWRRHLEIAYEGQEAVIEWDRQKKSAIREWSEGVTVPVGGKKSEKWKEMVRAATHDWISNHPKPIVCEPKGCNIVYSKKKKRWFIQLCTKRNWEPSVELDFTRVAVARPGKDVPWLLDIPGRDEPLIIGDDGLAATITRKRETILAGRYGRRRGYKWSSQKGHGYNEDRYRESDQKWRYFTDWVNRELAALTVRACIQFNCGFLRVELGTEAEQRESCLWNAGKTEEGKSVRKGRQGPIDSTGWPFYQLETRVRAAAQKAGDENKRYRIEMPKQRKDKDAA